VNPVVEGPVGSGGTRGRPWNASVVDLRPRGYVEEEYFLSGRSQRLAGGAAPYRTRMLVRRPVDPSRFNGIAVVEWLNVSLGADLETVWPVAWEHLTDEGYMYVGVSVQQAGICCGPLSLQVWDPQRYGDLRHPGGEYAIFQPADDHNPDIFRQAVRSLRYPADNLPPRDGARPVDPTGGLDVEAVVATGNSQSAGRLTTFINLGYDAADPVVDAFVLGRAQVRLRWEHRSRRHAPVFVINEETQAALPPDSDRFVVWEEAGTSHGPQVLWDYLSPMLERDAGRAPRPRADCAYNRGSVDYTSRAMMDATRRYLATGILPPRAPRLERGPDGALLRDDNGLARGGLRQPFIAVPVAFNSGEATPGCSTMFQGTHRPWPAAKIRELYPEHRDYVRAVTRAASALHAGGFLIDDDRADAIARANAFRGPWEPSCRTDPNCVVAAP
jgi:hypothetical protein